MEWTSVKDRNPEFGKRVFVALGRHLNTYASYEEKPFYYYYVSIATYCCSKEWKLELINPTYDKVFFWKEIPNIGLND